MPNIDYTYEGVEYYNVYTYMGWQLITDQTSPQYELREQAGMNFDSEGFGKIGNRYVIACTDPNDGGLFGTVGDYIDWVMPGGATLYTIVGDTKDPSDPNWIPLGHTDGDAVCVIEFVVDKDTWYTTPMHVNPGNPTCHPEWKGNLQSFLNRGNYFKNKNGVEVEVPSTTPGGEPTYDTVGGAGTGGDGDATVTNVGCIELYGSDQLLLRTGGDPILFYKASAGLWRPARGGSSSSVYPTEKPDNPGPTPKPDPDPVVPEPDPSDPNPQPTGAWAGASDALAWCQAHKYCYSYNQAFYSSTDGEWCYRGMDLTSDGECDCSGFVWKVIHTHARDTFNRLANAGFVDWSSAGGTGSFWQMAQNTDYAYLLWDSSQVDDKYTPPSNIQPGDLFLTAGGWYAGEEYPAYYTHETPRHVLMYMADGTFWDVTAGCGYTMANDNWGQAQTPDVVFSTGGELRAATRWVLIRPKWVG